MTIIHLSYKNETTSTMRYSLTVQRGLRSQLTDRVKQSGEVFTPVALVRQMLDCIPESSWRNQNKTWFEPSAGDGNFLVEIQAKLLALGHNPIHVLENMLFSVELIDDNHWFLQHRLGYLIDGQPNPALKHDHFEPARINRTFQDLNHKNPYEGMIFNGKTLEGDQVLQHRNHICASALSIDLDTAFGIREEFKLPKLRKKAFSWDNIDTSHLWPADLSSFEKKIKIVEPAFTEVELKFVAQVFEKYKSKANIEKQVAAGLKLKKLTPQMKAKIAEMLS